MMPKWVSAPLPFLTLTGRGGPRGPAWNTRSANLFPTYRKGPAMLNIPGPSSRFCDGVTRRNFLKIGAFAFGASYFSLADIYRAEAVAGRSSAHKAVINIFLGGGPPHQDMWEIKTEAPNEIRGEFRPIATNVNGIQICEV